MNNIQVKPVDVLGDTIIAAKDDKGQVWAGVSYFCKALGMSNKQRDTQVEKVQTDRTLRRGTRKFPGGVFDPNNEVVSIKIDFIPLWLAKIQITKKMEQDHPELADKLLKYQLQAKDILAAAFMPHQEALPLTLKEQVQTIAKGTAELYGKVEAVTENVKSVRDELKNLKNGMPVFQADTKDIQNALRKKAIETLGGKDSNAYRDKSIHAYAFADIQIELRRQFNVKRYDQIRHKDVADALRIIEEYKPPLHIKNKIAVANAQQSLDFEEGGGSG